MTTPVMLSDGEYTAVADKGAKTMNVYNLKGKAYTVNTEGVITTFAINPLGYSVVMCQSSGKVIIQHFVILQTERLHLRVVM